MPKTAFVTGSNGFLGINLIKELLKRNWQITALYLPKSDVRHLSGLPVDMVSGDISDYDLLCGVMPEEVDTVFHLAANTSAWSKNNAKQYNDNVSGTQNVIKASMLKKSKKFIYTSSISAYGYHPDKCIDENTISNAMKCGMNYHKTKFMAENIVRNAASEGLDAVILNPCNIIGPYDINNWTRQFLKPIYENNLNAIPPGKAMWCHVKDIVDAHINAVEMGRSGHNYLLGGVEAGFIEVVNEIERLLDKKKSLKVQPAWLLRILVYILGIKSLFDGKEPLLTYEKYTRAAGYIRCNFDKAKAELNYKTTPLNVMLKDSYDWLTTEKYL